MTGQACPPPAPDGHDNLTQYRLTMIEQTLQGVRESLDRLTTLEQRHIETREAMAKVAERHDKLDVRVRDIELEMPTLKLIRGWVLAGVIACAAMLGATLFKVATMQAPPAPALPPPAPRP